MALVVMVVLYCLDELMDMRRHAVRLARAEAERMQALMLNREVKEDDDPEEEGYFDDRWNFVDLCNYGLFGVGICFEFYSRLLVTRAAQTVNGLGVPAAAGPLNATARVETLPFVSFYLPAWLSSMAYTLMGVNAVVTWLKTLKYLNEFPHLSMLSKTLANACYPIASFLIMFFIVFIGCSQAFNMTFGPYMEDYASLGTSMMSLFRALLGEFDYVSMERTDRVIGPLLFLVFMLLVLFVLLNMFIAILAEAYEKAKIEVFGDMYYAQDEHWVGAVSFIEYTAGSVSHGLKMLGSGTKKALCGWRSKAAPVPVAATGGESAAMAAMAAAISAGGAKKAIKTKQAEDVRVKFSPMQEMKNIRKELAAVGGMLGGAWSKPPIWVTSCCRHPLSGVPCLRFGPCRAEPDPDPDQGARQGGRGWRRSGGGFPGHCGTAFFVSPFTAFRRLSPWCCCRSGS